MSIIIGIDHGYYAIKTAHCSFPAGLTSYGEHEPYTRQGLLEFGGCFFVCGSGRQPIQRDKTINDNYYLLTLAAIAKEIRQRGLPPECSVRIAAGLPLTSFGRDKPKFREYLLRSKQPVNYKFEGVEYSITIEEVAVFPQGYAALMTETGLLQDEPSMLLMDLGGWTVDLMRIDNAIPAADTAHSLELGMIRCVDDIREQVRRETGLSLTDAQIENMLAGHPCTVSDTVRDIVNKQGRKYTEHLLSATMEAGFDLHAIPAVLLGGGASVVSRHLSPKDGLCKTIFLLDDKGERGRIRACVGRRVAPQKRGMKRPQYVFRPNLNEPQHCRAWALLQQMPPAKRKEFLVQSILAAEQTNRLEKSIRKVVREELQAVNITNAVPSPPPANAIPDSALDFLSTL